MKGTLRRLRDPAALTVLAAIAHELLAAAVASGDPFVALLAGGFGPALLAVVLLMLRVSLFVFAPAWWLRALVLEASRAAWAARGGATRPPGAS